MRVRISSEALAAIRAHVAEEPEREACGLLFGSGDSIEAVARARNVAPDPARCFEIDPVALFAAIRAERAGGPKVIGCYHSHPNGRAEPSVVDRESAARDGNLWLIVAADVITAWRAGEYGFERIELSRPDHPRRLG